MKLTKCDKVEWGEKSHYQVIYFLNDIIYFECLIYFSFRIILC